MTRTIRLRGVLGVPDIDLDVPEGGGLVVLAGKNGAGKSRALAAIAALTDGEGKVPLAEDAVSGEVSGFGASIHLGARTSRGGHLDVVGLTSRMDIASIVDPGFVQRDAANRAVVKALIRMLGQQPTVDPFVSLLDSEEEFREVFPGGPQSGDDLVDLARRVKAACDEAARKAEAEAERLEGESTALMTADPEIPQGAPAPDLTALRGALDKAIEAKGAAVERDRAYKALERAAQEARDEAGGEDRAPTAEEIAEAGERAQAAKARIAEAKAEQLSARDALAEARRRMDAAEADLRSRLEVFYAAQREEVALMNAAAGWKVARDAQARLDSAAKPTPDELASATTAAEAAHEALARATMVQAAIERRRKAQGLWQRVLDARERGARLREAGRGTDAVLSELLNAAGVERLYVSGGVVMARMPDGKDRPYLDLSDGERTKLALDSAIPVARRGVPEGELALIVLGQRVYQDLDYSNRQALAEYVRDRGVLLWAAIPTEGDLVAEVQGSDDELDDGLVVIDDEEGVPHA